MTDHTDAIWADGPKVVEWIEAHLDLCERNDDTFYRAMLRWRNGGAVNVWALDRLLIPYERHLSELPGDVWLAKLPRYNRPTHVAPRKTTPLEPRFCEECGKKIPRGTRGREKYKRARFCSIEHRYAGAGVNREFVARGYRKQAA